MDFPVSLIRRSATIARVFRAATICSQCRRSISSSAVALSGHNKWSKIKHEKGRADKGKATARQLFSSKITLYTKLYGPDPTFNSQLATAIAGAKKAGMPKAGIDLAVARGQGKSATGQSLETAILEVMMPPSVAMVVEIETDNKNRTLSDLKLIVKKHGGLSTPTTFLFEKRGCTVLKGNGDENDLDEVLEPAIEAGAEDVEADDEGNIVVWTQPNMTHQAAQNLSSSLKREILSSDIIWSPASDRAPVDDEEGAKLMGDMLAAMREIDDVQAIYSNAERGQVSEEVWSAIEEHID